MIRNPHILEKFERERIRNSPPDYFRNLRIVEGLAEEAKALKVWPPKDSWAGIESKIELARRVNVRRPYR